MGFRGCGGRYGYLTFLQFNLHYPILSRSDDKFPPSKRRKITDKLKRIEYETINFKECPHCKKQLVKQEDDIWKYWACPECDYTRNIKWKG